MLPLAYREAELPQLLPVQYQAFVSIRLCRIVVNLCHSECLKRLSDSVANDVEIAFGGVSGLGSMTRSGDEIKRH